ncbi:alpha/beta hydrolase [Salana multivorans]
MDPGHDRSGAARCPWSGDLDALAPWSETADLIPGARLLTFDGDGHGIFGGRSACVDMEVTTFLLHGDLPSEGAVC